MYTVTRGQAPYQKPAPAAQRHCPSVLVVDDDEYTVDNMRIKLLRLGVTEIATALQGHAALAAMDAMAEPPDLVICDIFMPKMDGIEFIDALVKRHYRGYLILITGMSVNMLAVARTIALSNKLRLLGTFSKPLSEQALEVALASMDL